MLIYYFKTLKGFLFSIKLIDRPDIDRNSFLMVNLIISSVPIFFIGYVVAKLINYNEEKIIVIIGVTSILFGIILFIVDKFCLRIKNLNSNLSYVFLNWCFSMFCFSSWGK